jgi:DNA polymerase III alpha subunit
LASKSAFKDICKVYNIPYYLSNELAKLIPDDKDG